MLHKIVFLWNSQLKKINMDTIFFICTYSRWLFMVNSFLKFEILERRWGGGSPPLRLNKPLDGTNIIHWPTCPYCSMGREDVCMVPNVRKDVSTVPDGRKDVWSEEVCTASDGSEEVCTLPDGRGAGRPHSLLPLNDRACKQTVNKIK